MHVVNSFLSTAFFTNKAGFSQYFTIQRFVTVQLTIFSKMQFSGLLPGLSMNKRQLIFIVW